MEHLTAKINTPTFNFCLSKKMQKNKAGKHTASKLFYNANKTGPLPIFFSISNSPTLP